MTLRRVPSDASLKGTQALRGYSWRRPQLEQPKHLVYKKVIKPLMEKRRRDRIAHCLNQLKTLLADAPDQSQKSLPNSRVDKAALLEMTVQRVQSLQLAVAEDNAFHNGYSYCASLAQAFLASETRQQPEVSHRPDSTSSSGHKTTPQATPLPSAKAEQNSWRREGILGSASLRCSARSVPHLVLKNTGPQLFWRPWST